jgi:hypothetical protein
MKKVWKIIEACMWWYILFAFKWILQKSCVFDTCVCLHSNLWFWRVVLWLIDEEYWISTEHFHSYWADIEANYTVGLCGLIMATILDDGQRHSGIIQVRHRGLYKSRGLPGNKQKCEKPKIGQQGKTGSVAIGECLSI